MKKILTILTFTLLVIFTQHTTHLPAQAGAQTPAVTLHLFYAQGCPHCKNEKAFLETIKDRYPTLVIKEYEVTTNPQNQKLLTLVGDYFNTQITGVPFTVIGTEYITGFRDSSTTGTQIITALEKATNENSIDVIATVQSTQTITPTPQPPKDNSEITVPILGTINPMLISLPVLTIVIGLLDGFNPCAMWVLLFLISLLIGMQDRKRMWFLGGAFILTSGVIYFLFLSAWLNVFLMVGMVVWVRALIGLVALGAGGYYLWDFYKNKSGLCKVTKGEKKQKVFLQIQELVSKRSILLATIGVVLLAISVNAVELICSAGLPAVYTHVLSQANIPTWQYYLYLLLYIVMFMLDDLLIFAGAMVTLRVTGLSGKYSRFSHLIGGIALLIIGVILLLKPELLMFG